MDGAPLHGKGRFTERLGQRGVRVARAGDVLAARSEGHRGGSLGDQVARARSDDVDAEQAVGPFVRQHLEATFRLAQDPGAAVGEEGEQALVVLDPQLPELLLRLPDRGNLRRRVDDAGDGPESQPASASRTVWTCVATGCVV